MDSLLDFNQRLDDLNINLMKMSENIIRAENEREGFFGKIQLLQEKVLSLEQSEKALLLQRGDFICSVVLQMLTCLYR
jgi:hypothetical protein